MNVTAHQEKEKNETKKGRRKERKNRRPILRNLSAAFLRSFRGQHREKVMGSARGNWDPREVQTAISNQPKLGRLREMKSWFADCEADALTTTPSRGLSFR